MAQQQADEPIAHAPLGGTRAQALQRLQVGVFGLAAMILLIGLAQIFSDRARETDAGVVPEAAPTVEPSESPAAASDPLADAGVGPDLPADSQRPAAEGASDAAPQAGD